MAYYSCGPCGVRVQQKNTRGNTLFMKTVRPHDDPDDAQTTLEPARAAARESREIWRAKAMARRHTKRGKNGRFKR